MGQGALNYQGVKSGIKLNDVIEDFKYVYKGQTIEAGDLVNYITGVAREIKHNSSKLNISTISSSLNYDVLEAVALDSERVLVTFLKYSSQLSAVVLSIVNGNITINTELSLAYSSKSYLSPIIRVNLLSDKTRAVVLYSYAPDTYDNSNDKHIYGTVLKIDGTTITKGSNTWLANNTYSGRAFDSCLLSNTKLCIVYAYSSSWNLRCLFCTISGTSLTDYNSNTQQVISSTSNVARSIKVGLLDTNKVFVAHSYNSSSYYLRGIVFTVSGTTITKGSDTALSGTNNYMGYEMSVSVLSSTKVMISCCYNNSLYHLYTVPCSISGTTISPKYTLVVIGGSSSTYAGRVIDSIPLNDSKILVLHSYSSSYYLHGIILGYTTTSTLPKSTDFVLDSTIKSAYQISGALLSSEDLAVLHADLSTSNQLCCTTKFIDIDNDLIYDIKSDVEYEQQVTPAIEPPFDAVALSSGVGALEGEITKVGNILPTSDWNYIAPTSSVEYTDYTRYKTDKGMDIQSNWTLSSSYPVYYASDGNANTCWKAKDSDSVHWVVMRFPNLVKIPKMQLKITRDTLTEITIRGRVVSGDDYVTLYQSTTFPTELTEITLDNVDFYSSYQILTYGSGVTSLYTWRTAGDCVVIEESTEHNEQVKIARVPKLLSSLPIGTLVKDVNSTFLGEPIIWKIADKNHEGYPDDSVTLISDKILALRAFDAKEPNNSNSGRQTYGNNRYSVSNIRQWLNSDAEAGNWYSAQHDADTPPNSANMWQATNSTDNTTYAVNPYDTDAGFLNGFSNSFKNVLLRTTLTVALNTVTDGGGSETIIDKIFLASNTEVGLANENNVVEGSLLPIFNDNTSRLSYCTTKALEDSNYLGDPSDENTAWYMDLRTPNATESYNTRYIHSDGELRSVSAISGLGGIRPLCNIPSSIRVSEEPDEDGCYTLVLGGED